MGANLEGGGSQEGGVEALCGERLSGSGPYGWQCGYRWMRERQVATSASDLPGCLGRWRIWGLDIKNTSLQADGLGRKVFVCATCESDSNDACRIRKGRGPSYRLKDAPAAARRPLRKSVVNIAESPSSAGLKFDASSFDPFLCCLFRGSGGAIGAIASRYDDISGCEEPDLSLTVRRILENRFWRIPPRRRPGRTFRGT